MLFLKVHIYKKRDFILNSIGPYFIASVMLLIL